MDTDKFLGVGLTHALGISIFTMIVIFTSKIVFTKYEITGLSECIRTI